MINLLDSNNLTDNLPEFTVSDLSLMIKKRLKGNFLILEFEVKLVESQDLLLVTLIWISGKTRVY